MSLSGRTPAADISAGAGRASSVAQPRPPRGRPRSERSRAAVLKAASELLAERGLAEVSVDAIARRAAVSKATIYRWWPTKEAVALDALSEEWALPGARATGTLRGDLLALLGPWVSQLSARRHGQVMAALVAAAHNDPAFGELYASRFVRPRRERARAILERARLRGELAPCDPEVALDLICGPLYHRLVHGHAPLCQRFVEQLVDTVIAGIGRRGS